MTDDTPLSIGRIDYINVQPVYYGLTNGMTPAWITMVDGPPAVLNGMIRRGELAVSPISAAFYAMHHQDLLVLPDLSISCDGDVMSVILMSDYPIDGLDGRQVCLTEESATAAMLLKLMFFRAGIRPDLSTRKIRSLTDIPDQADAALIIGDAALTQPWEERFQYRLDLGALWRQETGLPFVFALWVVRRDAAAARRSRIREVLQLFYESRKQGYGSLETIINWGAEKLNLEPETVRRYYDHLYCDLDDRKIQAANTFFRELGRSGLLPEPAEIRFFDPEG